MENGLLRDILVSFMGSLLAVLAALLIERRRLPNIEIIASDEANDDNKYNANHPHPNERWKFFRVAVRNKPFIKPFHWIPRQTATNCRATLDFSRVTEKRLLFSMMGRWASTAEIAYIPRESKLMKVLYPDPVSIPVNEQKFLDVITKYEKDSEAYAWNNEAYLYEWRTPKHRLDVGEYNVRITVHTENGISSLPKTFKLIVGKTIEKTRLLNLD